MSMLYLPNKCLKHSWASCWLFAANSLPAPVILLKISTGEINSGCSQDGDHISKTSLNYISIAIYIDDL